MYGNDKCDRRDFEWEPLVVELGQVTLQLIINGDSVKDRPVCKIKD